LGGVPIVIKDNLLLEDHIASASSKMLEIYQASYTATALKRLQDAGAYFIGRANMDEFAMGSSTETSAFGPTLNPLDHTRVPGGSSGGSAAAVAAGLVPVALGTDTAGSIRQPAAMCGIVGMKGTYGSVSRYGAIAMGSSLDQIGPMANTVQDCKTIFNIMRGEDQYDLTTITNQQWHEADKVSAPNKWVIGVPWSEIEREGIDDGVLQNFNQTLENLKSQGVEIRDIELPTMKYSLPAYYIIMPAEVSSNLGRYDGIKFGLHVNGRDMIDDYFESREAGFGDEVQRRILLGTYVLSAGYYDSYYGQALQVREAITREFIKIFESGIHGIATPTTPGPAFKIGEKTTDPVQMYLEDIFTIPANIAQIPAISIPNGSVLSDGSHLPTGFQLMCPHLRDNWCFRLGELVEKSYSI
jgi:aspartyl-tRNA(Asn)/glutamyl-tRNA(Gln) amidotransferase subunit A